MHAFSSCLSGDPTNLPSPVRDCRRAWCSGAALPAVRCVPASARPGGRRAVVAVRGGGRGFSGSARRVALDAAGGAARARFGRSIGLAQRRFEAMRHLGEALIGRRGVGGRRRRCRLHRRGGGARFGTRLDNARFGARFERRARRSRRAQRGRRRRRRTRRKLVGQRRQSIALRPRRRCRRRVGLRLQRRPSRRFVGRRLDLRRRTRRRRRGDHFGLQRPRAVAVVRQRDRARQRFDGGRAARSATSREAATARTILASTTTSVGPPIIRRCSTLSRRTRIRRRRASTLRLFDDAESRGWRPRVPAPPSRPRAKRRNAHAPRRSIRARAGMPGKISRRTASPCRTHHPETFAVLPVLRRQPIGGPMVNSAGNICRRDY